MDSMSTFLADLSSHSCVEQRTPPTPHPPVSHPTPAPQMPSVDATKKLVSSVSFFRDYFSSLLASLPDRLQRVQHNAARLVLGRRGRDHAKPLLRSLHWLPVSSWIEYKIPPCAIVAEILLVLPTCLVFSLSTFPLSAFCRHWTHYIKLNKYGKRALILMHTTCDLDFPFQTST